MSKLFKHQETALKFALPKRHVAFFMEMRLGKTRTAIRWAKGREAKRVMVICPKAAFEGWEKELKLEGEDFKYLGREDVSWTFPVKNKMRWYLVNYEFLLRIPEMVSYPWGAIILDESTKIKNPQAKVTKLLIKQTNEFSNRAILTGLPDPEGVLDYVMQMFFLSPGGFMGCKNFWNWRDRYCVSDYQGWNFVLKRGAKEKLTAEIKKKAFILTRAEAGMGSKKIYERRYVDLKPEQTKLYNSIKKDFEGQGRMTKWVPVQLGWMQQVAGGVFKAGGTKPGVRTWDPKFKELLELVSGELKNEKIVVWFKHTEELLYACQMFKSKGITASMYYGKTKTPQDLIFKHGRVLCAQAKCGMMGIDWSEASTAIYYSNWWDGELRAQSEDRIIHPQKKEPVLIIDILVRNTIDQEVLKLLQDKQLTKEQFAQKLAQVVI